jgi:glycosyltransferase involved in cell wall biosynthesis
MKVCTIIIPCYGDSASLDLLLPKIREARFPVDYTLEILVINDTAGPDVELEEVCGRHKAELLTVPFHMGHQEAMVFGIRHCVLSPAAKRPDRSGQERVFVTMDADGQDDPDAIGRLLEALQPGEIVVAQRIGKRPEGLGFSTLYFLYKRVFRLLVGFAPDFGNFAAFDAQIARHIAVSPHFDIAYSLSLPLVAPIKRISVQRLPRLRGSPKLGFIGLFDHSLRLLLPHWKTILRRVSIASAIVGGASLGLALVTSLIRLFAPAYAFPNWATTIAFGSVIVCIQLLTLCVVLYFIGSLFRQIAVSSAWRHARSLDIAWKPEDKNT